MHTRTRLVPKVVARAGWAGLVTLVAACGGSTGASAPATSGADTGAAAGRELAAQVGCASCHGADGQGGVGPAWVGLAGSRVTLTDGTTVTADHAYLVESIANPQAKRVAGYPVPMPDNALPDETIAALVAYIESLASP